MQELQIIENALNKANLNGTFNLGESMTIGASLNNVKMRLEELTKEVRDIRANKEAAKEVSKEDSLEKVLKAEPKPVKSKK